MRYHISNFGLYGKNIPVDMNGYTYTTAKEWMKSIIDFGTSEEPSFNEKLENLEWSVGMAQQARLAIKEAEIAIADWRNN
jgi:hypothetical protein